MKLVDHGLVNSYKPRKISDLIGDFNYLGTVRQSWSAQGEVAAGRSEHATVTAAIWLLCLTSWFTAVATAMRGDQHGDVPDSPYEPVRSICYMVPRVAARRPWSRPSLMS